MVNTTPYMYYKYPPNPTLQPFRSTAGHFRVTGHVATNDSQEAQGLDVLLGHLLVKRIPVMYKLSSTKIPEY